MTSSPKKRLAPVQWHRAAPRAQRSDLIAVTVFVLLIAVKSWERLHFGEWLRRVDIINQYMPWWGYLGKSLRAGDIPGWNPYQFGGTPFLGDPQSGWMYFPAMVPFLLLSPVAAMKAYVVVQLLIGGLSTMPLPGCSGCGRWPALLRGRHSRLVRFFNRTPTAATSRHTSRRGFRLVSLVSNWL